MINKFICWLKDEGNYADYLDLFKQDEDKALKFLLTNNQYNWFPKNNIPALKSVESCFRATFKTPCKWAKECPPDIECNECPADKINTLIEEWEADMFWKVFK